MPRSFDLSVESSASVEQIHSAFSEEDYWLARLAAFGGIGTLDSLIIGTDGSVTVVIIQDLRHEGCPGWSPSSIPVIGKSCTTRRGARSAAAWCAGRSASRRAGAPGSGFGAALLAPAQNGSRLKCTATVEFKVPLVGGKIESLIGRQVIERIAVIQRFTTKWITEHA